MSQLIQFKPWDPFRDLWDVSETVNRFLNSLPRSAEPRGMQRDFVPAIEVSENEKEYVVRADLPGLDRNQVQVSTEDGILTLQGQAARETERKEGGYYYTERNYGSFSRMIRLPEGVDESHIQARHENGVLTVTLPKQKETAERKKTIAVE